MNVLLSIQHNCTWFTIDLIKTAKPAPRCEQIYKVVGDTYTKYDLLYGHLNGHIAYDDIPDRDRVKYMLLEDIKKLHAECKIVVPLRDPVESLITRQARHPELNHVHHITLLEFLTTLDDDNVFFFPGDIKDKQLRKSNVVKLFKFIGLQPSGKTEAYVKRWKAPAYNITNRKGNPLADALKKAYVARDWDYLNTHLKKEFDCLKEHKEQIMTFLKRQGYDDLPWFTDDF